MTRWVQFCLLFFLLGIFSSCKIEKARPFKKQFLNIASDCLEVKDTLLFKSLKSFAGIRVRILPMSADSLRKRLVLEGLNTEIDAVILSSMVDMVALEKSDRLQHIPTENLPENLPQKYLSKSKKWVGIGCDPYVIVTLNDTLHKIRSYSDLAERTKWCTDLNSDANFYPFYSAIVHRINYKEKYNAHDWIKHFVQNKVDEISETDSTLTCKTLFTNYSSYKTSEVILNSKFSDGKLIFPNQRTGGTYFSMPTFAIIKQARNYTNALSFLDYLLIETVNKRLNFVWKTFPIVSTKESTFIYQNTRFKKFNASPVKLTEYYDRVKNIINLIH